MFSTLRTISAHTYKKIIQFEKNSLKHLSAIRHNSGIIKSAIPDVDIPNETIPEFVFKNFLKYPQKIALECNLTGKKFTFEEVLIKSKNLGAALRKKLKLAPGDIIAILLPNVPEYPICAFGALQANLSVTTINPIYTPDEISRQLDDTEAKVIFTLTSLTPIVTAAFKIRNRSIPVIGIKMQASESIPEGVININEFLDNKFDIENLSPGDTNDVAFLPYSSGTTGLPKGVELTHRNIIANICQAGVPQVRICSETTNDYQDVVPGILPFFHIFGMNAIMCVHLHYLCKVVTMAKFTPEQFLKVLINHKPQILFVVPPIVNLIANQPVVKKEYLQSVQAILSGAAPLGPEDEQNLRIKLHPQVKIKQGYGLTETSPAIFMSSEKSAKLGVTGTVGELLPNSFVKLVKIDNPEEVITSPREPGELLVQGPQVMKRYFKNEEETKNAFSDGWFKTGDAAYYDENNLFFITERLKELIKVKGFQVAPAELESILRNHPDLSDAAVIGVPHKQYGEVPKAYVVAKPNHKIKSEDIQNYVANKVAKYKQLKGGVTILDSIPKNPSGKILRGELKKQNQQTTT